MKRKVFIHVATIAVLMVSQASAQTYTEIFSDGWGQGRRFIRPCFTDLDNDGLLDLLLGEHEGGIQHLEQNAVGSIHFTTLSTSFNAIDVGSRPTPTCTDLDNDARLDLVIGRQNGTICHYEQDDQGSASFSLISENFNNIDVEGYATPRFIDLDQDDLLDLIVGRSDGTLSHYKQNASGSAEFTLVTDSFNVIDVGYTSTPAFTDLDGDGLFDMIVGASGGLIQHYEQVSPGTTEFSLVSDNFNGIDIDAQACPVFTDVDNDGFLDLMIGGMFGFLYFYEQESVGSENVQWITNSILPGIDVGSKAVPTFTDLDFDGVLDMIVGTGNGLLKHYHQNDPGSSLFDFVADTLSGINIGYDSSPVLLDLDGDALLEMFVGDFQGNIHHYRQASFASSDFTLVSDHFNDIEPGDDCAPVLLDLNDDGLTELIIGKGDGTLSHYEQDESGSMSFSLVSDHFNDIDLDWLSKPCFTDLQDDGLWDMIIGESEGALYHYKQAAVGSMDFTLVTDNFQGIITDGNSAPVFADVNGDGLEDLFVGSYNGGIRYFQAIDNTGLDQELQDPASFVTMSIYPNPMHNSVRIQYTLQKQSKVKITITNTLGQVVRILENSDKNPGSHTIQWDGTDAYGHSLAGGTYICTIHADAIREFAKLSLVR